MRIRLADEERSHRYRPARRKRAKRRRSQTYQVALPMPQAPSRPKKAKRASTGRGPAALQGERVRRSRTAIRKKQVVEAQPIQASTRASTSRIAVRLGVLLLLGLLIAALVYGSTDARFFVYEAGVIGAEHLSAQAIYHAAGIDEQSIFWIDPAAVAQRIVQMDGVKVARVRCELPAAVTVEVEERQPKVLWRIDGQKRDWWLDEDGVVLPYHGDAQAPEILFVVDSSERELAFGQRIEPQGIVASVVQLAAALPGSRVFFYDGDRGLSFTQKAENGQWPVYVGSSEDLELKIQVMQALTGYLAANGITPRYVDVRWAAHPVYGRPLGETAGGGE